MVAIIITVAYFLIMCIAFGTYTRRKISSDKQFFTASKQLGWFAVMVSLSMAPLGGGHTAALWQQSGFVGVGAAWWGVAFGGLMVPIFLLWFGPMFIRLKVQTFPQAMGKIFGPRMKVWNSAIAPAGWMGILMSELFGAAMVIYTLSGGALSVPMCVLISGLLNILYVWFAGMLQASYMNIVNAAFLIVGSFFAIFWLGSAIPGGYQGVADTFAAAGVADKVNMFAFTPAVLWGVLVPVVLLSIFSVSSEQKQYLPMLAARDIPSIKKGAVPGGLINAMSCIPFVILGVTASAMPESVVGSDAMLAVPHLIIHFLPPVIVGILMVALLCALLSTGAGVILAMSHVISDDLIKPMSKKERTPKKQMWISRGICLIVTLMAAIPSLWVEVFMELFFWCFSLSLPIFVCYLIAMIWKVNRKAAWINLIISMIVNCWWTFATPAWCPPEFGLSFYPVFVVTFGLGIILAIVLPGEKSMLKQLREQEAAAKLVS